MSATEQMRDRYALIIERVSCATSSVQHSTPPLHSLFIFSVPGSTPLTRAGSCARYFNPPNARGLLTLRAGHIHHSRMSTKLRCRMPRIYGWIMQDKQHERQTPKGFTWAIGATRSSSPLSPCLPPKYRAKTTQRTSAWEQTYGGSAFPSEKRASHVGLLSKESTVSVSAYPDSYT